MAPKWVFDAFVIVGLAGSTLTLSYCVAITIIEARRGELWRTKQAAAEGRGLTESDPPLALPSQAERSV